jgi:hypothetical protein
MRRLLEDPRTRAGGSADALIREARRLRRRRWAIGTGVAMAVLAATGAGLAVSGPSSTRRPASPAALSFGPNGPTVNAKAFAGEGDLAFVSRGTAYVLDGATGVLRRVALPSGDQRVRSPERQDGAPSFSQDGRWLAIPAMSTITGPNRGESTLWIAKADGSHLREVTGFDDPKFLGWSPTSDVFAATSEGDSVDATQPTSLWVVSPSGVRRELVRPGSGIIDGATWSSDGSAIAVGGLSAYPFQDHVPWAETLTSYPLDGAKPTIWLRIVNPISNGCCDTAGLKQSQFVPVGWWPHWGIVFWGASADVGSGLVGGGFPLFAIPASGDKPIPLGATVAGGQVSTIVASTTGEFAISDQPNPMDGDRPFWQNEQVLRCDPTTLRCAPVASPTSTVSFDPVWSPDGQQLAYLDGKEGPGYGPSAFSQSRVATWYNSLQLWLYSARTGRSTELPAATGAVVPIWSANSRSLLYIGRDGLWLLKNMKGQPVEIAGPLLPPNDWNPYFAQVSWAGTFAWSRSQNVPQPAVLTPM